MGMLVEGRWSDVDPIQETGKDGDFRRVESVYREFITADGSSGFRAERGRYHLYVAHGCPWAHRTVIYRSLKKLKDMITIAYAIPGLYQEGWTYEDNPAFPDCSPDRVNGFRYLHQAYTETDPYYTGKVTVPVLWDKKARRIVNNESADIIRMLNTEFASLGADPTDYYPAPLRGEIDRINELVYTDINNGVYRCGFARSQEAYNDAYDSLFAALDEIEERLNRQRYLVGRQITEADWRLFPTLVRFDVAYFSLFKCNRKRIADYPNLLNYMRETLPGARRRRDHQAALLRAHLLFDQTPQSFGHHSQGDAGRLPAAVPGADAAAPAQRLITAAQHDRRLYRALPLRGRRLGASWYWMLTVDRSSPKWRSSQPRNDESSRASSPRSGDLIATSTASERPGSRLIEPL